ncbi:MAG TPA: SRPBCC domain-containing protein [Chryseolinea sp.]|jgi:hypothetical protein|nr:SRPBCC domain-containing protein [Chryseolinea sp.]
MNKKDYSTSITVKATPRHVFESINNVSKWWTENFEGKAENLNDEFTVRFFHDIHVSTQKLVEVIPDKKVVWLVTDCNLNFVEDKKEWINTKITFEIFEKGDKTQIRFTHIGLDPGFECFNDCSNAWGQYVQSLSNLITSGKGNPTLKDAVIQQN